MLARLKALGISWKWLIIGSLPYFPYALLNWFTPHHQLITILDDAAKQSAAQHTRYMIIGGVILGIVVLMIAFAFIDLFNNDRLKEIFVVAIWSSFSLWMLTIAAKDFFNVEIDQSRVSFTNATVLGSFIDRSEGRRGRIIYSAYLRVRIPHSEDIVVLPHSRNLSNQGKGYRPPEKVSFVYGKGYFGNAYIQQLREAN